MSTRYHTLDRNPHLAIEIAVVCSLQTTMLRSIVFISGAGIVLPLKSFMRDQTGRHRANLLVGMLVLLGMACTSEAFAQPGGPGTANQAAARDAYNRAAALLGRKEYTAAARQFALADQLVPTDSVLADALDASVAGDDAAFGSMLVARVTRRPRSPVLESATNRAREKFRGRAGRIEVRCPATCEAEVDGKAIEAAQEGWLPTGPHVVTLTAEANPGHRDEHRINVAAADTVLVTFQPPTPASPTTPALSKDHPVDEPKAGEGSRHGLAPTWFWVGAGVTALVAGGAALSWADASSKHSEFKDAGCAGDGAQPDCVGRADDGKSAITRTNVLIGVASASAVATAVIGIFLVDWKPRHDAPVRASFSVEPGGARAVVSGSF